MVQEATQYPITCVLLIQIFPDLIRLKAHWVMGMKRNELGTSLWPSTDSVIRPCLRNFETFAYTIAEAKIEKETTQLERLEIPGTPVPCFT